MIGYASNWILPSQGKDSSDEEDLDDIPDDDQYDTEDSFIDDAELVGSLSVMLGDTSLSFFLVRTSDQWSSYLQDEYFEVDNAATKHDGFFVNKGKLEFM